MTSLSLRVVPCSHQDAKSRRQGSECAPSPPEIAPWRNNLTALSQYRNLYFVAGVDKIYVFQPRFPRETVPIEPVLVISLPASRPGLKGYINYRRPQAANHIIIKDLGDEEILLIACDGGDVIGYTTRSVALAVGEQQAANSALSLLSPNPFFHENVGDSAWGLDVHQKARLLAVSCNSRDIIIFAFALINKELPQSSIEERVGPMIGLEERLACDDMYAPLSSLWKATYRGGWRHLRDQTNFAFTLTGHMTNIPNISFLNSTVDPDACPYLASIDIEGNALLWDVWERDIRSLAPPGPRGWAALCLDRRSARLASNKLETYGCEPNLVGPQSQYYDNSDCCQAIQNNSHWHRALSRIPTVALPSSGTEASGDLDAHHENTNATVDAETDDAELDDAESDDEGNSAISEDSMGMEAYNNVIMSPPFDAALALEHEYVKSEPADDRLKKAKTNQTRERGFFKELPCNILLTGETDLLFIDHGFRSGAKTSGSSHDALICRKPVQQTLPPSLQLLRETERLNMIHQIPELGIVAIGNQAGRVALLTMTYWPEEHRYGFKVDAILPFKLQEEENIRPQTPMLGMAISPVQGQSLRAYSSSSGPYGTYSPRSRDTFGRYRLLMMYYDRTILSYEISRPGGADDGMLIF
ncbi:MAG: hypothetical protein Q9163_002576 [Psora crenata]